jgi:hypothetical protein
MSGMQRDLEELGTHLWPETEALRPRKPVGRGRTPGPRNRRRGLEALLTVAASALLIAALGAAFALGRSSAQRPAAQVPKPTAAVEAVSAAQLATGHWSELPPAPITPRMGASVVWTGTELLVWGGESDDQTLHGDGAAYNPTTRRWRTLPPAPLSPRVQQAGVWDGGEMLIWGGYDQVSPTGHVTNGSAAYDPKTDRWRTLPPAPLSARAQVIAVWTGTSVILLGGDPAVTQDFNSLHDGAAYHPSTDQWTPILPPTPPPGHPLAWRAAVQAGNELLGFSDWATITSCGGGCSTGDSGTDLFMYNEQTASWHLAPPASGALRGTEQVFWTGRVAVVRGGRWCGACTGPARALETAEYDPVGDTWTSIAADPLPWGYPLSTWTGGALLSFNPGGGVSSPSGTISPGEARAYDAKTGWVKLPPAPTTCGDSSVDTPVWTGHQVFLYCPTSGAGSAAGEGGIAYTVGP